MKQLTAQNRQHKHLKVLPQSVVPNKPYRLDRHKTVAQVLGIWIIHIVGPIWMNIPFKISQSILVVDHLFQMSIFIVQLGPTRGEMLPMVQSRITSIALQMNSSYRQ